MDFLHMKRAFPDFPEGDVPLAIQASGWDDDSYQHDVCPSFRRDRSNLKLYINRLYPQDRYEGRTAPRFNLHHDSDGGSEPLALYVGDEFAEVQKYVAAFEKGMGL